jgi:hypothetical protein
MRSGDMAHWPSLMLVGVAVWALQASNLRPPPCKDGPGGRDSAAHRLESHSDQHRCLSLFVVGVQCFSTFHGLGTDLRRSSQELNAPET